MPFGLQLKSLIIGAILAYFVLPRIIGFVSTIRSGSSTASA